MIYILTGDIRSGKTTALLNWCNHRDDVNGLLCPDDTHGKRYFFKVKSKERFSFEVDNEHEAVIEVGPFRFLKSAFVEGNEFLISEALKMKSKYVIIDELGKLELKNNGLHQAAEVLIPQYIMNEHFHLILVVRESLLQETISHYHISEYSILEKAGLVNLK